MKKIIAVALALTLAASLAACGGVGAGVGTDAESSASFGGAQSAAGTHFTDEIGGEITISCYDTMNYRSFLEDAAKLFEEKYPGTTVNIETFSAMPEIKTSEQGDKKITMVQIQDDPQGRADYINKINTALMGGAGADIFAMDVLPVHKYARGGQLENLDSYMDTGPDFNRDDLLGNILDAIRYNGGTWFLPINYTFNYYAYDTALLPKSSEFGVGSAFTVGQLIELAKDSFDGSCKLFNMTGYSRGPRGDMWDILLAEHYASFVDIENKKANFDGGSFAELLESVKRYGSLGYISEGVTGQSDAGMMMGRAGDEATDRFFFKPKSVVNLMSLFTRNLGMRMNMMAEGGIMDVGDDDGIAGIAACGDGSVSFTYSQAYGINADSRNKATAWAFLSFLLGEEMQLNTNLPPTALPLNNAAREKKMETMMASMAGRQNLSLNEAQLEAIAEYNEAVERLSSLINAYVFEDTVVNDMISAEVQYFFEGSKTSDEVAKVLQNKVGLYLNE